MAFVLDTFYELYFKIWESRDKRLQHLPFMNTPLLMIIITSFYFYIIKNGKKFMQNRNPMNIKGIIIVYNILQIIANSVIFLMLTQFIFNSKSKFSFLCEPSDFSNGPTGMYVAHISYAYFILKLADYLDTIFFILRKKSEHVSFLHVYHHVATSIVAYLGVLFSTGGQGLLLAYLNTFVHAVMYNYYLLSIWKPEVKSNKSIKKNITKIQMLQVSILGVHFSHGFIFPGNDCGYPKFLSIMGLTESFLMVILFADFYWRSYGRKPAQKLQ